MIDSHFHFDDSILSAEQLVASMDAAGIERTVLLPWMVPELSLYFFADWLLPMFRKIVHHSNSPLHKAAVSLYKSGVKPDGTVDLLGKRFKIKTQPDNDLVLKTVAAKPDRFYGLVFINPAGPDRPMEQIEKFMNKPGMIGVKAHPFWHDYPVSALDEVAAACEKNRWPLLIHLGQGDRGDFRTLPDRFPNLRVIYAHIGLPYAQSVCGFAGEKQNVFVDISCTAYVGAEDAKMAIRIAGIDKVLFGTDGPYFHSQNDLFDYPSILKMVDRIGLSTEDKNKLMKGNFLKVYSL